MLSIFNQRRRTIDKDGSRNSTDIFVQLSVEMRHHLKEFNDGRTLNAFALFMAISLHTDQNGWAWPGYDLLSEETDLTPDAIARNINKLMSMRIAGQRVLAVYKERLPNGRLGRTFYRVFPDIDEQIVLPTHNGTLVERRVTDEETAPGYPHMDNPYMGKPYMDNPYMDNLPPKYNHSEGEPSSKNNHPEEEPNIAQNAIAKFPGENDAQRNAGTTETDGNLRGYVEDHAGSTLDPRGTPASVSGKLNVPSGTDDRTRAENVGAKQVSGSTVDDYARREEVARRIAEAQQAGRKYDADGDRVQQPALAMYLAQVCGKGSLSNTMLQKLRQPMLIEADGKYVDGPCTFEMWDDEPYAGVFRPYLANQIKAYRKQRGKAPSLSDAVNMARNFEWHEKGTPHAGQQAGTPSKPVARNTPPAQRGGKYDYLYED